MMPTPPFPLAEADRCVKCGLCLPQCPTYALSHNEADSPRGRIALMQGLAQQRIPLSEALERHLDGCLGCRACEQACPAAVPYGALIDAGRAALGAAKPARLRRVRILSQVLQRSALRAVIRVLLRLISPLRHYGQGGRRLHRGLSLIPRLTVSRAPDVKTPAASAPSAHIFVGCVGDIVERGVAADLTRLLARCGWRTQVAQAQTCCGALDQHAGRPATAATLAQQNIAAFDGVMPILPLATGCAATLLDYPRLNTDGGSDFASRVRDPLDFLLQHGAALAFKPLTAKIAVHEPCTQRNVIRKGAALRSLLARIPGIELIQLDASGRCCGAAGTYFLTTPDAADALLQPKLDAAREQQPTIIVSANIGCSLHLAAGLRRAGIEAEVLHPLQLLAQQLI